ncbi:hypothetical protein [Moorena producens]|nr:hypothetical protein [Moorena producens]
MGNAHQYRWYVMGDYHQLKKGTLKGTAKPELDLTLYKCVD